jgi:hypothetical protein
MMSDVTKAVEAALAAFNESYFGPGGFFGTGNDDPRMLAHMQKALAAFLDAVKDCPTEEMLTAACNTPLPGDERESHLMGWQAMCLALRRGVAGDRE